MSFKFVHTADWQIGKSFRAFDVATAGKLGDARLKAIESVAGIARATGAAHVLVAGDVYDTPSVGNVTVRQPLERMRRAHDLKWWLLPGNHDPARPGGVWDRVITLGCPPNVTVLTHPVPVELERGVWLLPSPLTAKSVADDPTAWMDGAETPSGAMRIGLAHGSVRTFGSDKTGAGGDGVIDPQRAQRAGLSYLALGDWHGLTEINPKTWYCGTPEPDRYLDNDAGFALAVSIEAGVGQPQVTRHRTATHTWIAMDARIAALSDLADLTTRVLGRVTAPVEAIVHLTLSGHCPATVYAELAPWREALAAQPQIAWLEIDTSGLTVAVGADEIDGLGDETLRAVARKLMAMAAQGDAETGLRAQAALAKLFEFTRRTGGVTR